MKRNFALVLAVLFTIFTLPINGLAASEAENFHGNLADGTYNETTAKAMNATEDEASLAAGFINEKVKLSIKDGKAKLTISIPETPGVDMEGIQIENQEPKKVKEENNVKYFTYELDNLKTELNSRVQYVVDMPGLQFDHDVPLRFILETEEIEFKTKTEEIEFETIEKNDSSLDKGETKVKQEGKNGLKEVEYEVTYINGKETESDPTEKEENIKEQPVDEIILIGTKSVVVVKTETDTETIKFKTDKEKDSSLEIGKEKVKQEGKNGSKEVTYDVTYTDGKETDRKSTGKEKITKKPIDEIILIGTIVDDGFYTLDASYLHADEDKSSSMAGYMNEKVFLSVQDGKYEITVTVKDNKTVTKFQVEKENANLVKIDGENRHETFDVNDIFSDINAYAEYQAPYQGGTFEGEAEFRISLDSESLKPAKAEDQPGYNIESPEPGEDVDALIPDKAYEVKYEIKHEDGINESVANTFFTNKGKLLEKDGKTYIQMTITSGDMIKDLKGKYGEFILVKKNDDGSIVVQLRVDDNLANMPLDMHVIVPEGAIPGFPGYDEDHKALLVFDRDSKNKIKVGDHELAALAGNENGPKVKKKDPVIEVKSETKTEDIKFETVEENDSTLEKGKTKVKQVGVIGTKEVTYEVTYTDGKETDRKVKKESTTKKSIKEIILVGTKEPKNDDLTPEKVYEVNYTIKHENGVKDSVANQFFTNKGKLLEKDGKTYLQMTITNGDMVKGLKGKYGEAIVVKENSNGSIVVQLRVGNDLANMLLDMHIIVPDGAIPGFPGYDEDHEAILVFDKDSRKEIEVGNHMLAAIAGNENGPKVSNKKGSPSTLGSGGNGGNGDNPKKDNGINKPKFGDGKDNEKPVAASVNNDPQNPQTGDTSSILLYTLLLIGSMVPLVLKFGRRFV